MASSTFQKLFAGAGAALTLVSSAVAETKTFPVARPEASRDTPSHDASSRDASPEGRREQQLPFYGPVSNTPELGAPPHVTANGTFYTSYVRAAGGHPAIVQVTDVAQHGLSMRATTFVHGTGPGSQVEEARYLNDMEISRTFGTVETVYDQSGKPLGVHVVVNNVREEHDTRFKITNDADERQAQEADKMNVAAGRLNSALQAVMKNGLMEERSYPADYVSIVPEPPRTRDDFGHRPYRAWVQIGDWRFEVTSNSVRGENSIGFQGERLQANGDMNSRIFFGPKHANLTSLRVFDGQTWVEIRPQDERIIQRNRYPDGSSSYSNTYQGTKTPASAEPYFVLVKKAATAAQDVLQQPELGFFPGLPRGAPRPAIPDAAPKASNAEQPTTSPTKPTASAPFKIPRDLGNF